MKTVKFKYEDGNIEEAFLLLKGDEADLLLLPQISRLENCPCLVLAKNCDSFYQDYCKDSWTNVSIKELNLCIDKLQKLSKNNFRPSDSKEYLEYLRLKKKYET